MVERVEHRHESDTPLRPMKLQVVELEADVRQAKTGSEAFGSSKAFSTVINADKLSLRKTMSQFARDFARPATKIEHGVGCLDVLRGQIRKPAN
jgi:hypothetical protein